MCKIGVPDHDQEARDAIVFGFLTNWFLTEVLLSLVALNIATNILIHVHVQYSYTCTWYM